MMVDCCGNMIGFRRVGEFCAWWWGAAESPIMGLSLWSAFGLGFAFFSHGMAACRGNMLEFRFVCWVLCVVVGCGRISESGVCPCGVLSGLGLRFFCAGWLLVLEICLGSGELAEFCAWWWGAAESPITGSVPGGVLLGGGLRFFRAE
jgi:hypothetical protein